jgi:hypothetical protein
MACPADDEDQRRISFVQTLGRPRPSVSSPRLRASAIRSLGPPLIAFVLAAGAIWIGARVSGYPYFRYLSWHRFDSGYYVHQATQGATLTHCRPPVRGWCGSAGWFPGYSIAIAGLGVLPITPRSAALALSRVFSFGTLVLVWVGLLRRSAAPRSLIALAFAAFVPGQIYDYAVSPLAMASFFVLLTFVLLDRRRWAFAGLAGAVACATYPSAIVLAPVTAIWALLVEREAPRRVRASRVAQTGGVMTLGVGAVLLIDKLQTGAWDAYFRVQGHFHRSLVDPLDTWLYHVERLGRGVHGLTAVIHFQAVFVGLLVLALVVYTGLRRGRIASIELLALVFAVAVWLFPLSLHGVHAYRSDALLIVTALLVRRLPLSMSGPIVACGVALSVPMAAAFFERVLV